MKPPRPVLRLCGKLAPSAVSISGGAGRPLDYCWRDPRRNPVGSPSGGWSFGVEVDTFGALGVEYAILGPLEARVDGRLVQLGGLRQRSVLVSLLMQPNTVVPAARIIDGLWPDDPPASAANLVQGYISDLRKSLGRGAIETDGAGYRARVDGLDLLQFERLAARGGREFADGRMEDARDALREALALWRGPALAELAEASTLQPFLARLEELRLLAQQRLIEAELAGGRHGEVIAEAEWLARAHPLRERPRALFMIALYRCGRQAEALAAYREGRELLVDELGIEPGKDLQELERAMLRQDPALDPSQPSWPTNVSVGERRRTIVAAALSAAGIEGLLGVAVPLARDVGCEIVVVATVAEADELGAITRELERRRVGLQECGVAARTAAFTSLTPGADLARLADEQHADLLIVDAPDRLLEDARLLTLLHDAPCDTAVLVGGLMANGPVMVPFAGAEHDWAAIELGAWLARSIGSTLQVIGSAAVDGGRDASRLLANASLAVQHTLAVAAEPLLIDPSSDALADATESASVVVVGLTERWRREGLGRARSAVAARSGRPTLLVRGGLRPGALAPVGSSTRFTWTIAAR